jgi:hypothetical protein
MEAPQGFVERCTLIQIIFLQRTVRQFVSGLTHLPVMRLFNIRRGKIDYGNARKGFPCAPAWAG